MFSVVLLMMAVALYATATSAYVAAWLGSPRWWTLAPRLLVTAVALHAIGIAARWIESERPPLSNSFEALAFYGWLLAVAYLLVERRIGHRGLGVFVTPIALVAIVLASILPKDIRPLIPMLWSYWLGIHVSVSFLALATFTVAFAAGAAFLYLDRALKRGRGAGRGALPSLVSLDALGRRVAPIGFLLMTGSLVSGSIWAEKAWGVAWVWQPQQVASVVTWFIYAVYVYTRAELDWTGRRSAWLLVAGFAATLFTFVGADLLLPSALHNYMF